MQLIVNFKIPIFLWIPEDIVKDEYATMKDIPPKSFNMLIVTAFSCNKTATIRPLWQDLIAYTQFAERVTSAPEGNFLLQF